MTTATSRTGAGRAGRAILRRARKELLREWRGCDEVPDLGRRVHHAASLVEAVMESLRAFGLSDGLQEEELRSGWKELAGDFIARHSQPDTLKNGVLTLRVGQATMRFHMESSKALLLERLRSRFGADRIREIRFRHG